MNFKVLIPQLGARGLPGAQIINGTEAPGAEEGNDGDFFLRYGPEGDTQLYGPKNDGAWGAGRSIRGGQGLAGLRGWNPVLLPLPVNVEVSEGVFEPRILVKLAAWIGGQGTAPTSFVDQYVNAAGDGFTEVETEALDLRGEAGVDGVMSGMEAFFGEAGTLNATHKGKNVIVAAEDPVTLTLEDAETLGPGWMAILLNEGSGPATIEVDGEDLIDGAAEMVLAAGDSATIWTRADGEGFRAVIHRAQVTDAMLAPQARVDVASAATTDIGVAASQYVRITGTTTITSLGTAPAGVVRDVLFGGALTLTHNATSLILPGGANIATAAGDTAVFRSEGSGNWRCVRYQRAQRAGLVSLSTSTGTTRVGSGFVDTVLEVTITPRHSGRVFVLASFTAQVTNGSKAAFGRARLVDATGSVTLALGVIGNTGGAHRSVMTLSAVVTDLAIGVANTFRVQIEGDDSSDTMLSNVSGPGAISAMEI